MTTKIVLVVLGLLILAGVVVLGLVLSGVIGRTTGRAIADAVFRPDSAGRYPNEPGWVDEGAA